jgi:hypothetical protein
MSVGGRIAVISVRKVITRTELPAMVITRWKEASGRKLGAQGLR